MDLKSVLRAQWDRIGAVVLVVAGLIALLLGYLGVSDTPYVAAQLPFIISGGLLAIFLLSLGIGLWLSADLRDDWRELRACRMLLEELGASDQRDLLAPPALAPESTPARRRPLSP